ncbi:lasso peptide biosynthesis B2 protein [Cytobacillus suaedae]|nr:lasso peptide biosynthesis B2 protein [Cytobacillus suaedae]
MFKKINLFLRLETKIKLLLFEAFVYLGWARYLKSLPFSRVSKSLGDSWRETSYDINPENLKYLKSISHAIDIVSRYTFWESKCLVKAIAGMKMLEKRKVDSTLYLGTSRDENGKMIAHAWLRSGQFYISGSEGMEKFTVVGKFAKEVRISSN